MCILKYFSALSFFLWYKYVMCVVVLLLLLLSVRCWKNWMEKMGLFFVRGKFNLFTHFKSEKFLTHFSGFLFQHKKRQKLKAIFRQFTIGKVCQYFLNSTSYQSLMLIEHMRYHHMDMFLCFIHIFMLDAF